MSDFTFPFRRLTRALKVSVNNVPSQANRTPVPDGFIQQSFKAFMIYNPNKVVVCLRGTSRPAGGPVPTEANLASTTGEDWCFEPGFMGVFSTQNPIFMSAAPFYTPRFPDTIPDNQLFPIHLYYGMGA